MCGIRGPPAPVACCGVSALQTLRPERQGINQDSKCWWQKPGNPEQGRRRGVHCVATLDTSARPHPAPHAAFQPSPDLPPLCTVALRQYAAVCPLVPASIPLEAPGFPPAAPKEVRWQLAWAGSHPRTDLHTWGPEWGCWVPRARAGVPGSGPGSQVRTRGPVRPTKDLSALPSLLLMWRQLQTF